MSHDPYAGMSDGEAYATMERNEALRELGKVKKELFELKRSIANTKSNENSAESVLRPITIGQSATADTRTCDYAKVSRETLLASSKQHIVDVSNALAAFADYLRGAAAVHDADKITGIDWFHRDFVTGFKETGWWDNHRRIWRHHLAQADGVPADVNLLDVLEYIADCVMAGKARSGTVTPLAMPDEVLRRAFENTVSLLANAVTVEGDA